MLLINSGNSLLNKVSIFFKLKIVEEVKDPKLKK